jgi:phosphatidylserine synthase
MNTFRTVARGAAILGLVVYAGVTVLLFLIVAAEGNAEVIITIAILAAPAIAALLYLRGIRRPNGRAGQLRRILGWFAMLAGSVALISFSFVVWPALLIAAPYTFTSDAPLRRAPRIANRES